MFEWSDRNSANARNAFSYIDYSAGSPVERVVYAMKDREWIFFQSGDPLWFEDVKFYKRRLKIKRINKDILEMYLMKLDLNIRSAIFPTKTQMGLKFIHT